jgi:hypothetical protein
VNRFHLIFDGTQTQLATVHPLVTVTVDGGPAHVLRQLEVSAGHFTEFVVLSPGQWLFQVTTRFGPSPVSFAVSRSIR